MWYRAWLYDSFCMNMDSQDYDLILAVEGKIVLMILNSSFQRNSIYQNDVVAVEIPGNMSKCSRKQFHEVKLLQIGYCSCYGCTGCEWICLCVCVCPVCVCGVCICVLSIYVSVGMCVGVWRRSCCYFTAVGVLII